MVSVYAIPRKSEFKCSSSIKGFNGITCNALNFIDVDVPANPVLIDFSRCDKSANADSGALDDGVDIFSKYFQSDSNILIVSHQSICNAILKIVNKSSEKFKGKLPDKIVNGYEKGKICLVYDKDWTYKPIN